MSSLALLVYFSWVLYCIVYFGWFKRLASSFYFIPVYYTNYITHCIDSLLSSILVDYTFSLHLYILHKSICHSKHSRMERHMQQILVFIIGSILENNQGDKQNTIGTNLIKINLLLCFPPIPCPLTFLYVQLIFHYQSFTSPKIGTKMIQPV